MGQQANNHFTESRYQLTQGKLAVAQRVAAKAVAAEPETPLWLFVAGSIEAAQFWMSKDDREAALRSLKRIFAFPGPYDFGTLKAETLQPVPAAMAQQHQTAALDYLTKAGQLANGADQELIAEITSTARELEKNWVRELPPPPVLVSDQICLLDVSVESALGVAWVNDLPPCPIMMLAPHWDRFTSPQASPVARKLRAALMAMKRFRQEALPVDIGKGADPILDQLWRRGSEFDIVVVTTNPAQVRAADGLRKLSGELSNPQTAPIRRKLTLARPAAKLPEWLVPNKPGGAAAVGPLPSMNGKKQLPLFSAQANEQVNAKLTPIEVATVDTGSVVRTGSNDYRRLVSPPLGAGGEGTTYLTDGGDVCKAYLPGKATVATFQKLQLMAKRQLHHPLVCWPTELVYRDDKFVGYLMPKAQGQTMKTVTIPKNLVADFPGWTRRDLAKLALSVCTVVEYLNQNNILVGDLSDTNIMVDELGQPWFFDTDSYQFGAFPSPVARQPFIHPDLLGKDLKSMFRQPEHEWFALATLVFMILFPGQPPYFGAGADDANHDHRDRIFPYRMNKIGDPRLDQRDVQLGPTSPFIWSNLPDYVRKALWAVFREGKEKISALAPGERPFDATFWRETLARYVRDLEVNPRVSKELLPTRYLLTKPKPDEDRRVCEVCNSEFNAPRPVANKMYSEKMQRKFKVCGTCLNTLRTYPCEIVGRDGKPCKKKHFVKFRDLDEKKRKICIFHQTNPP